MKLNKVLHSILICLLFITAYGQENTTLTELFRNSYSVYERMRDPLTGIYQAKINLNNNNDLANSSIAVDGMALVTVCIADKMGWITDAEDLVIETLTTLSAGGNGFTPDRNPTGYYRHFFNKLTGVGTSEFSTVDNAVFMSGVRFCKNYFSSHPKASQITALADTLLNSIDWSVAVVDPNTDANGGGLYLAINEDGTGPGNNITRPYNEYVLVAWLAYKQEQESSPTGPAQRLWDMWYAQTANLYKVNYGNYDILTVKNLNFQAEHTYQMPYYLCNYYTTNSGGDIDGKGYLHYMENIKNADKVWFQNADIADNTITIEPYEWAMSAGSGIDPGTDPIDLNKAHYSVDKIDKNPFVIVSPHTLAAYMPVNPGSKDDFLSLYTNNKGVYSLPWDTSKKVVWRYSIKEPTWLAPKIQGVDFAPLVFGIATLPEYCGSDFFSTYNDFNFSTLSSKRFDLKQQVKLYPNPVKGDDLFVKGIKDLESVSIYNVLGIEQEFNLRGDGSIDVSHFSSGVYILNIDDRIRLKFIRK
ncbi:T9SS type A sorting domain-containing protein [Tamlana sp. 2201CG12-4]|uniref:T9SS type A sorting domain-containing protein n=1 Tax=Tamlana sp. 2201CG12-4 TaxID=3112582 RepID=UPI002DB691B6|nr:T9SS type A sorting domain-containing protein [Tamlana sp. 2201CG12-4]MEC3905716.1 T9SS type A sorting domain-containing protein [Tamlana sp. 2201CG12-4]